MPLRVPHLARSAWTLVATVSALACTGTESSKVLHQLHIAAGNSQTSRRGDDLPQPLRVRALDSNDEPIPGVTIHWAAFSAAATVSPSTSITNAAGEAETRVTNLAIIGEVTVGASVPASAAPPVNFTITSLDPCRLEAMPEYSSGAIVQGRLRALDCTFSDRTIWDFYKVTVATQEAVVLRVRSDSIRPPEVGLWDRNGKNRGATVTSPNEAVMKVLLAPGPYGVGVSSLSVDVTGPYEFSVTPTSTSAERCELVFVVRGVATTQQLTATDCDEPSGMLCDFFSLVLHTDDRVVLTVSSAEFAPRIRLVQRPSGTIVAESGSDATDTATLDYTATAAAAYRIYACTADAQKTGAYTLAISFSSGG